jgi:hypothetical protein
VGQAGRLVEVPVGTDLAGLADRVVGDMQGAAGGNRPYCSADSAPRSQLDTRVPGTRMTDEVYWSDITPRVNAA